GVEMMKKILGLLTICLILLLAACGDGDNEDGEDTSKESSGNDGGNVTLTVGAQSVPHAEILEEAKPLLEDKNITLEIEEYQDFVLPNDDLADGRLDANYFQHIPYLEQTIEDTGYDLDYIGKIHIEPMGIYSQYYNSIDEIPDGTEVILSNSVADHGRILSLFEEAGLITLEDGINVDDVTLDDIVENPKDLTFSPDYEPAILPELYESESDI